MYDDNNRAGDVGFHNDGPSISSQILTAALSAGVLGQLVCGFAIIFGVLIFVCIKGIISCGVQIAKEGYNFGIHSRIGERMLRKAPWLIPSKKLQKRFFTDKGLPEGDIFVERTNGCAGVLLAFAAAAALITPISVGLVHHDKVYSEYQNAKHIATKFRDNISLLTNRVSFSFGMSGSLQDPDIVEYATTRERCFVYSVLGRELGVLGVGQKVGITSKSDWREGKWMTIIALPKNGRGFVESSKLVTLLPTNRSDRRTYATPGLH